MLGQNLWMPGVGVCGSSNHFRRPCSLWSGQVEDTEEFGRGAVREKRIEKLLDQKIWDWCGIATCFAIIAAVVLAVLLVLDAVDVMSGIAEAWERSTALVLGIPGVLTVLQLVSQVGNATIVFAS